MLKYLLLFLALPAFGGAPYLTEPTNNRVNGYVPSATGPNQKWIPAGSGGGATNSDGSSKGYWQTNSVDGSITNINSTYGVASVAGTNAVLMLDNKASRNPFLLGRNNGSANFLIDSNANGIFMGTGTGNNWMGPVFSAEENDQAFGYLAGVGSMSGGAFDGSTNSYVVAGIGSFSGGDFSNSTNSYALSVTGGRSAGSFANSSNSFAKSFYGSTAAGYFISSRDSWVFANDGSYSCGNFASAFDCSEFADRGSVVGGSFNAALHSSLSADYGAFLSGDCDSGNNIIVAATGGFGYIYSPSVSNVKLTMGNSILLAHPPGNYTNSFDSIIGLIGPDGKLSGWTTNGFFSRSNKYVMPTAYGVAGSVLTDTVNDGTLSWQPGLQSTAGTNEILSLATNVVNQNPPVFGYVTNFITTNTSAGATQAIISVVNNNFGYTTNFATTNTSTGLTNAVSSIVTNQMPNWIHGRTNYLALFNPNTNEVSASIMFQTNGTTEIAMRNGDAPVGNAALSLKLIGLQTSETVKDWLDLKYSVANTDYEIMTDKGSGGTLRQLTFGVGGTRYWNVNTSGHFTPITSGANDIGAASDGVRNFWSTGGALWRDSNGDITHPIIASGGANGNSIYLGASLTGFMDGSGGVEYIRFDLGPNPVRTLDLGVTALAGGNGVGARDAFMSRVAAGTWQIGTNQNSATLTTNRIQGAAGSGSNIPGGSLFFSGGASTGTGTSGHVGFETATNGAAVSTPNGRQTRTFISAHPVALTSASATLVLNVALTAGQYAGITVTATTFATDGTDLQSITEVFVVNCVNKAGTVTRAISAPSPGAQVTPTAGTLTTAWTAVANGNGIDIKNTATSSLTTTTFVTTWEAQLQGNGPLVVTPQ